MGSALLLFIDISFLVKFSVFSANLQSILIIILRFFSDDSKICFAFGTASVIHSPPLFFRLYVWFLGQPGDFYRTADHRGPEWCHLLQRGFGFLLEGGHLSP